jgi:hypothetical protein
MAQAHTSDRQQRDNVSPHLTVPTVTQIDDNARISALITLCTAVNAAHAGTPIPAQNASYNNDTAIKFFKPCCVALAIPAPISMDHNNFVPLFNAIATALG